MPQFLNIKHFDGYVPALDGLRGLAILLVLCHHLGKHLYPPLDGIFYLGWVGVDLFFVLSGYLITNILLNTKNNPRYYKNFIGRRTLRIFPLYYFALTIFFIFIAKGERFQYLLDNQAYFWSYTQNLLFAFDGWPRNKVLNHLWSLAIEEQFYVLWPFVILFFSNKNILRIAIFGMLLSLLLRNINPTIPYAYTFTFARWDTLMLGGIIAVGIRDFRYRLEKYTLPVLLLSALGVMIILAITQSGTNDHPLMARVGYSLIGLMFGALLITTFDTASIGNISRKIFEIKSLRLLGKYSYGIYVYHFILYNLIYKSLHEYLENHWYASGTFLVITLLVSYLSYHLFEVKFLQLKKYFS